MFQIKCKLYLVFLVNYPKLQEKYTKVPLPKEKPLGRHKAKKSKRKADNILPILL